MAKFLYKLSMLYYDRNDSEGINFNKTIESKEYNICHCWHFLDKGFKTQPNVYKCHDFINDVINDISKP